MKRFIFLSFIFMGLAFYELSGGADFDPVEAREAAVMGRTEAPQEAPVDDAPGPVIAQADEPSTVTRVNLNLVSFDDVSAPKRERPARTAAAAPGTPPDTETVALTPVTFFESDEPEVVIPSLIFPGTTSRASSADVSQGLQNVRAVSASRVNLRNGPGTGFGVVTQLDRDTQVEILQDDGSGWVRLRPVDGGPEGWIAEFLLTGG